MTVVVHLVGGLGNQLFQLAGAHQLAQQQGRDILVDVTEARLVHDRRGIIPLYANLATCDYGLNWLPYSVNSRIARRRQDWVLARTNEPVIPHTDVLETFRDDGSAARIHLRGLLMSRAWAEDACGLGAPWRPSLHEPSPWFLHMRERLRSEYPLAMHVRRGDFLQDRSRGLLRREYYLRAMAATGAEHDNVWVFSDDPADALQFLGLPQGENFTAVTPPPGVAAAEVMTLLSEAPAIVTSNSTFAWWAAFLSSAAILYPSPFAPETPSPSGLPRRSLNDPSWMCIQADYE